MGKRKKMEGEFGLLKRAIFNQYRWLQQYNKMLWAPCVQYNAGENPKDGEKDGGKNKEILQEHLETYPNELIQKKSKIKGKSMPANWAKLRMWVELGMGPGVVLIRVWMVIWKGKEAVTDHVVRCVETEGLSFGGKGQESNYIPNEERI